MTMNPAQQALDLLRNKVTAANVAALSDQERRQLESICLHWAALIQPPKAITPADDWLLDCNTDDTELFSGERDEH